MSVFVCDECGGDMLTAQDLRHAVCRDCDKPMQLVETGKTDLSPASVDATLNERKKTHGDYSEHANITQTLKLTMASTRGWRDLHMHERETLEMIAHKIGRILAGNPHFHDHWLDISGYAKLSADRNAEAAS